MGGFNYLYESGGSSHPSVNEVARATRIEDVTQTLRSTDVNLMRSKSVKQPKIKRGFMKTLRKKLGEAVSKFIIYECLPLNLANSPWLHNLIVAAAEVGPSMKGPTPYEISYVYLDAEFRDIHEWINKLKSTWKEK